MKKNILKVSFILALLIGMFLSVNNAVIYALGNGFLGKGFNENVFNSFNGGTVDGNISGVGNRILGTIVLICQALSFFGIVYAGIRYMYCPADKRAEVKKGLIAIAIGCVIVFSSATVISTVMSIVNEANSNAVVNNVTGP